jgi:hypothetical protein
VTNQLIDAIYQRHCTALALVNCDTGPARMALWLALNELAERQTIQFELAAAPARSAAESGTEQEPPAVEPPAPPAPVASSEQPQKRMGRPPGSGRKPKAATLQEIAAQLDGGLPPGRINPALIAGDDDTQLTGILRREETVVRHINGQPLRTTRQHIELR